MPDKAKPEQPDMKALIQGKIDELNSTIEGTQHQIVNLAQQQAQLTSRILSMRGGVLELSALLNPPKPAPKRRR